MHRRLVRFNAVSPATLALLAFVLLGVPAWASDPTVQVPQRWGSTGVKDFGETDSLAAGLLADGRVYVFATAKKADRIDVYDGVSGRFVRSIGKRGSDAGEFKYPNGIAYFPAEEKSAGGQACLLIVERDNARVQAIDPQTGKSLGTFGGPHLERPYGLALTLHEGKWLLYVTDESEQPGARVHLFQLAFDGSQVRGEFLHNIGENDGPGMIGEPESVVVDARLGRVLLCDEDGDRKDVKVYTLDGKFTGRTFGKGLIEGDPEGIALIEGDGAAYIVVTDQRKKVTVWHVFERESLAHVTSFTGEPAIANTDGICVYQGKFGGFAAGALFAVNNDRDVRAYDLAEVLKSVRHARQD